MTGWQYITAKWRWTKCKQLNVTKYACNHDKLHVISPTSLQHTSYTMHVQLEVSLNALTFEQTITQPQENWLYSECTGRCSLDSVAVQKRFGHSLQAYGFTASCRWICCLRWPLLPKFFWQMSHMNQVPSSCEFSGCVLSWWCRVKVLTVSTWTCFQLCISVNTNMTLQFTVNMKQFPTITTIIRSTASLLLRQHLP